MKTLILILCGLAAASAAGEWENFKQSFGKSYTNSQDESYRRSIFEDKLKSIQEHNERYDKGEVSYFLKINEFSDMTHEELLAAKTGVSRRMEPLAELPKSKRTLQPVNDMDWRDHGAVTPVKNQGSCGSCWAFAAVASLEGVHFLESGSLISMSEQNLVDCSWSYGNQGCNGGWPYQAYSYIRDFGVESEADYPYTARDETCTFDASESVAAITGYVETPVGDEIALEEAVQSVGPVTVCIDAGQSSFGSYGGGVYDEPNCETYYSNHAVTVVGFGTEGGKDYWLVKNSWGEGWGEAGYIKMSRNNQNQCAIATYACYPTL